MTGPAAASANVTPLAGKTALVTGAATAACWVTAQNIRVNGGTA